MWERCWNTIFNHAAISIVEHVGGDSLHEGDNVPGDGGDNVEVAVEEALGDGDAAGGGDNVVLAVEEEALVVFVVDSCHQLLQAKPSAACDGWAVGAAALVDWCYYNRYHSGGRSCACSSMLAAAWFVGEE